MRIRSRRSSFLQVIRETLQAKVADGIDQNALLAGINSSEFRFREADFGQFPKGLLYGIQCLDSWLSDDMQPFMHLEALDTYQLLKDQIGTGYYEELVKTYLLDNPHASVVITVPEQGWAQREMPRWRRSWPNTKRDCPGKSERS